jgi:hypothetical protein
MAPPVLEKKPLPAERPPAQVKRWGLAVWIVVAALVLVLAGTDAMHPLCEATGLILRAYLGEIVLVALGVAAVAAFTWIVEG